MSRMVRLFIGALGKMGRNQTRATISMRTPMYTIRAVGLKTRKMVKAN